LDVAAVSISEAKRDAPTLDAVKPDAVEAPDVERPRDGGANPTAAVRSNLELIWLAGPRRRSARVEPLAPARDRVQFTASAELRDKLERLQALMRSSVPDGDLAAVIEAAVTDKLERMEAVATTDTSARTRQVPAAVKRAVLERDGGRCCYVDAQGRRCTASSRLEFHHRRPFALGGDHSLGNVSLLCRLHNLHLAEVDFGTEAVARHRRASGAGAFAGRPDLGPG
jgi:5-methylcytosine-specific restriction endonuclease McrA